MTCGLCDGSGWKIRERGPYSGVAPCVCQQANRPSEPRTPLTVGETLAAVNVLCETLAFAPTTDAARVLIANGLMEMCETAEQLRYVISRAVNLHTKWHTCGLPGLRQILCSKYRPRDGLVITATEAYPEGVPPDKPLVETPRQFQLPAGVLVSADPAVEAEVRTIARAKVVPSPAKPITQADIDAILARRKKQE
jgi:hypothetical protein